MSAVYATSSACIDCGRCLRKCPVGAIKRTEGGYYLACTNCGQCTRVCPSKAIRKNARGGLYVDRSRCTGCGLCALACPIDIIRMEGGRPKGICMNCGICVTVCPVGARVQVEPISLHSEPRVENHRSEGRAAAIELGPVIEATCP